MKTKAKYDYRVVIRKPSPDHVYKSLDSTEHLINLWYNTCLHKLWKVESVNC